MGKQFCVIGEKITRDVPRNWYEEQDEAEDHAQTLLANKEFRNNLPTYSYVKQANRLLVVQVVSVVELDRPPMSVRKPKRGEDFGG